MKRDDDRKQREQRKAEREAQKTEFRVKYTRAFPSFVFHFDLDTLDPESAATRRNLESKVLSLGAVCFFVAAPRE
jgi:regulatory subunit for Cdc7p protein kinase